MPSSYRDQQKKFYGLPVPPHLEHGKLTAKSIYGCDCKVCLPSGRRNRINGDRLSRRDRSKRLRDSKRGQPVPEGVKHGVYAYNVYGHRCEICRAEHKDARRRTEMRKRRGEWINRPDGITVVHWPAREGWACPDCAVESAQAA